MRFLEKSHHQYHWLKKVDKRLGVRGGAVYSHALILGVNGLCMSCSTPVVNSRNIFSLIPNTGSFGVIIPTAICWKQLSLPGSFLPLVRDEIPSRFRILCCELSRPKWKWSSSVLNLLSRRLRVLFQFMITYLPSGFSAEFRKSDMLEKCERNEQAIF